MYPMLALLIKYVPVGTYFRNKDGLALQMNFKCGELSQMDYRVIQGKIQWRKYMCINFIGQLLSEWVSNVVIDGKNAV